MQPKTKIQKFKDGQDVFYGMSFFRATSMCRGVKNTTSSRKSWMTYLEYKFERPMFVACDICLSSIHSRDTITIIILFFSSIYGRVVCSHYLNNWCQHFLGTCECDHEFKCKDDVRNGYFNIQIPRKRRSFYYYYWAGKFQGPLPILSKMRHSKPAEWARLPLRGLFLFTADAFQLPAPRLLPRVVKETDVKICRGIVREKERSRIQWNLISFSS